MLADARHGDLMGVIFSTILKRANDTLAGLLTGSDVLTTGGLGFATASAAVMRNRTALNAGTATQDEKGKAEQTVYEVKEVQ